MMQIVTLSLLVFVGVCQAVTTPSQFETTYTDIDSSTPPSTLAGVAVTLPPPPNGKVVLREKTIKPPTPKPEKPAPIDEKVKVEMVNLDSEPVDSEAGKKIGSLFVIIIGVFLGLLALSDIPSLVMHIKKFACANVRYRCGSRAPSDVSHDRVIPMVVSSNAEKGNNVRQRKSTKPDDNNQAGNNTSNKDEEGPRAPLASEAWSPAESPVSPRPRTGRKEDKRALIDGRQSPDSPPPREVPQKLDEKPALMDAPKQVSDKSAANGRRPASAMSTARRATTPKPGSNPVAAFPAPNVPTGPDGLPLQQDDLALPARSPSPAFGMMEYDVDDPLMVAV